MGHVILDVEYRRKHVTREMKLGSLDAEKSVWHIMVIPVCRDRAGAAYSSTLNPESTRRQAEFPSVAYVPRPVPYPHPDARPHPRCPRGPRAASPIPTLHPVHPVPSPPVPWSLALKTWCCSPSKGVERRPDEDCANPRGPCRTYYKHPEVAVQRQVA
jgi:hypothetical protein